MSRYKGRSGAKSVERKFPHIVEMAVPLGGFGKRLDDMHEWHRARDIEPRHGRGWHEDECDYVRASLIQRLPPPLPLSSAVPSCAVSHRQIKSECLLIFSHCFPPFVDCVRGHKVDKRIRVGVSYPLR